jgi:hypothetical protein
VDTTDGLDTLEKREGNIFPLLEIEKVFFGFPARSLVTKSTEHPNAYFHETGKS